MAMAVIMIILVFSFGLSTSSSLKHLDLEHVVNKHIRDDIECVLYGLPVLTDDGRVIGLLPETERLQLCHQIFVHTTHHQGIRLTGTNRETGRDFVVVTKM